MIRAVAAALTLSALISLDASIVLADPSRDYPTSVLRLRGGGAFPDPDHQDPGPAWTAGGSVGTALNRNILVSLSYEHIDVDEPDNAFRTRAYDPLTVDVELGLPKASRFTPRLSAGAGPYFHKDPTVVYAIYTVPHVTRNVLNATFGMHFGAGLSLPISSRTMFDVDFRYHQTVGGENAIVVATTTAGLRFLFPRSPTDHSGYVAGDREGAAVASR